MLWVGNYPGIKLKIILFRVGKCLDAVQIERHCNFLLKSFILCSSLKFIIPLRSGTNSILKQWERAGQGEGRERSHFSFHLF